MDAISWGHDIALLLHLVGFAALFGGALVQLRDPEPLINGAMVFGAITELLTGLALVQLSGAPFDAQVGVKLGVTVVVSLLVLINRRFDSVPKGLWAMLTLLTLGNAAIAVLW